MSQLRESDRGEFLEGLGLHDSGLDRVIRAGYGLLGLLTFFTVGPKEARAWTVVRGTKAPQAAGTIHGDFERGFIACETIGYDDYLACRGEAGAKDAGRMRVEGKEYVVKDGDVLLFRFNVLSATSSPPRGGGEGKKVGFTQSSACDSLSAPRGGEGRGEQLSPTAPYRLRRFWTPGTLSSICRVCVVSAISLTEILARGLFTPDGFASSRAYHVQISTGCSSPTAAWPATYNDSGFGERTTCSLIPTASGRSARSPTITVLPMRQPSAAPFVMSLAMRRVMYVIGQRAEALLLPTLDHPSKRGQQAPGTCSMKSRC